MLFPKIFISVQEAKESDVRKFTAIEWYTFSWARCTHLIILVVANEGILFNKCSKMLHFCQKIVSFPTYLSSKSSINHLLDVTLFRWRAFGSYCPLRHWLPLTVRLPLTRRMNLDSSKRKSRKKKNSRCDAWRVADLKFNVATSCENLHNVNFDQQRHRYDCLCSLSSIPLLASLIAGYLPILKRMSMVQLVSVTEEADLNFTWLVLKSWRHISNDLTKFKGARWLICEI